MIPAFTLVISIVMIGCGTDVRKPAGIPNSPGSDGGVDFDSTQDASERSDHGDSECIGEPCELTCEVLRDPNFCWHLGVQEALACTDGASTGTMNEGGMICDASVEEVSFQVVFSEAVIEEEVIDREGWDFTVSRDSTPCLSVVDNENIVEVTTESGTTGLDFDPVDGLYSIECADGSLWQTRDIESLIGCSDEDGVSVLPGVSVATIGSEFSYGLLPSTTDVFRCDLSD